MAAYLFTANYNAQALRGLRSEGAASRIDAVRSVVESLGGTLESFYFAFGDVDAYVTVELPDDETAAAAALAVSSSGAVTARTVKLLTPDQVDAAIGKEISYRPPGG
jgi:uncharacterized protein with GYD domain